MRNILIFIAFLGIAYYIYRVFRKRMKYQSDRKEIDEVVVKLVANDPIIGYTENDKVKYFGSIMNEAEGYEELKQLLPMTDKLLIKFFGNTDYDPSGDNLLIFKVVKAETYQEFIVVVNDPADMDHPFSIWEILGPFNP
jgi:hypothetical protein